MSICYYYPKCKNVACKFLHITEEEKNKLALSEKLKAFPIQDKIYEMNKASIDILVSTYRNLLKNINSENKENKIYHITNNRTGLYKEMVIVGPNEYLVSLVNPSTEQIFTEYEWIFFNPWSRVKFNKYNLKEITHLHSRSLGSDLNIKMIGFSFISEPFKVISKTIQESQI